MRSRSKQGNKRYRKKLKIGDRVVKDEQGRPITIGLMHPMPEHWALVEKHRKEAAFWERIKNERRLRVEEEAERERHAIELSSHLEASSQ